VLPGLPIHLWETDYSGLPVDEDCGTGYGEHLAMMLRTRRVVGIHELEEGISRVLRGTEHNLVSPSFRRLDWIDPDVEPVFEDADNRKNILIGLAEEIARSPVSALVEDLDDQMIDSGFQRDSARCAAVAVPADLLHAIDEDQDLIVTLEDLARDGGGGTEVEFLERRPVLPRNLEARGYAEDRSTDYRKQITQLKPRLGHEIEERSREQRVVITAILGSFAWLSGK